MSVYLKDFMPLHCDNKSLIHIAITTREIIFNWGYFWHSQRFEPPLKALPAVWFSPKKISVVNGLLAILGNTW